MIKLEVEPYCQEGCVNFKVSVVNGSMFDGHIHIGCEHDKQCAYLIRYLKNKLEKEKSDD